MEDRRGPEQPAGLPSRDAIREFIRQSTGRVGKREIIRAFDLPPDIRPALRRLLQDMAQTGDIAPGGHNRFTMPGRLADEQIIEVTGTDPDGDAIARPVEWSGDGPMPLIYMAPEPRGQAALAPGQRVLARLRHLNSHKYEGRTLKRLSVEPGRILGIFRAKLPGQNAAGGRIEPTDRRQKAEWMVPPGDDSGAEDGEIVQAESLPGTLYGLKQARIIARLGRIDDTRSFSLISIHTHGLPQELPAEAIAQADAAQAVPLGQRTDLRDLPLVTIDGEDARDFDDAVYARPTPQGWHLVVAIADVAHYVRQGTALDRAAWQRGNSVYFPDRVLPMLPEALSNGWCSLRPHEDRGCLFVAIDIDHDGRKLDHRFGRGLMRSAARLTYTEVQALHDSGLSASDDQPLPVAALYEAYAVMHKARRQRGALDLDLPERQVVLDDQGKVMDVRPRLRLDSHRLIEEFMVLANVCAAEELERLNQPCMYRIHAAPSVEKLEALRSFLHSMDIFLPQAGQLHPADLDRVLQQTADSPLAPLINETMLRSQSQAAYSPENLRENNSDNNLGHFGLALTRYAHFTSPIRRYADLVVHRALIRGLRLGDDGLAPDEAERLTETAKHITATERRAALAERDTVDRYLTAAMADKIGCVFPARVSGVTRFGLFVTLCDNGANGLVPLSSLPDDHWMHDETAQTLTGRKRRLCYRLAQTLDVRLHAAAPVVGGLTFVLADMPGSKSSLPGRSR